MAAAVDRFGGLDGLVSNAGINRPGRLVDYAVDDWDRMFAVNTRATWLLAKAAYPALKASRGAIVAVASMSGSNAHANLGPYGPSKAAVIMLAKVLAQELGPDGIRVNTVSPGMVQTGMTAAVYADQQVAAERASLVPLGRVAGPEDMADVIAFLLGRDARYINGHDLVVDGGVAGNYLGRLPDSRASREAEARLSLHGAHRQPAHDVGAAARKDAAGAGSQRRDGDRTRDRRRDERLGAQVLAREHDAEWPDQEPERDADDHQAGRREVGLGVERDPDRFHRHAAGNLCGASVRRCHERAA